MPTCGRSDGPLGLDPATARELERERELKSFSRTLTTCLASTTLVPATAGIAQAAVPAARRWTGTTATCVAQIAPFVTPFVAAKAAQPMAEATPVINKSAQLGGLRSALVAITTHIVDRGSGLTAAQVAAMTSLYTSGLENLADALGIGRCCSRVREVIT